MREALKEYLVKKPTLYLEELVINLSDDFGTFVSTSTVSKTLHAIGWSKKKARRVVAQRNPDLRDTYFHNSSDFSSYHRVYVDESGCDELDGLRRTGWSPFGTAPVHVTRLRRGERFQILPAYTQDGILLARVFQGSTDSCRFEEFVEQLLPLWGRWPEPKSVLIMDNASFHRSERIKQMCADAGVILVYLPPYSPDLISRQFSR
jgi:DDE superfamily endonuclease/Winged helix-turn helix